MRIEDLLAQLRRELVTRIQNGQLTERSLARLTQLSQPHVHHILKGKRGLTPQIADKFLDALGLDLGHLIDTPAAIPRAPAQPELNHTTWLPLLDGFLGPNDPHPELSAIPLRFPFPAMLIDSDAPCEVARLGADPLLHGCAQEGDYVVLRKLDPAVLREFPVSKRPPEDLVYLVEDSWVLDLAISENNDTRTGSANQKRREWLHRQGRVVAQVLWLLRELQPGRSL